MDILTHTLSGLAIGTILVNFTKNDFLEKISIVFFSALGGAFPDIDAITLWSKFDGTLGKTLGLSHTGHEIYFSKFWYSHHAFFHSLFAGVLFMFLVLLFLYLIRWVLGTEKNLFTFSKEHYLIGLAFIAGYFMHLLGDTNTPAAVWGGVNLFWPSHAYFGGTGKIWWWNNYDIFLIIFGCIVLNTLVYIIGGMSNFNRRVIALIIGVVCFISVIVQINTRTFNFNYTLHFVNYGEYEKRSKQIQKEILNEKVYQLMEKLDNKLPIQF
jgi:inner membrane protein